MRSWPAGRAKARFGEFLDACVGEGPQPVTRRGEDMAVLVNFEDWRRLNEASRPPVGDASPPSIKDLLLADYARVELAVPARGKLRSTRL